MAERVFISYSSVDEAQTLQLAATLEDIGVQYFLDRKEIKWGDDVADAIRRGLSECSSIVVIVSPASAKSQWVPFEIGHALGLGKRVLPFLTHPAVNLPAFLRGFHYETTLDGVKGFFKLPQGSRATRHSASTSSATQDPETESLDGADAAAHIMGELRKVMRAISELSNQRLDVVTVPIVVHEDQRRWVCLGPPEGVEREPRKATTLPPALDAHERGPREVHYPAARTWEEGGGNHCAKWLRELSDRKFHAEWLRECLEEIRETVRRQFRQMRFTGTLGTIERYLELTRDSIDAAATTVENAGRNWSEISVDVRSTFFRFLRSSLRRTSHLMRRAELCLSLFQTALHEHQDLNTVLAMTVPHQIPVARTGSMHIRAAQRLIGRYLGRWNGVQAVLDQRLGSPKCPERPLTSWDGLVCSVLAHSLSTFPSLEVLLLPISAHYKPCTELPLIAHAAGHVVFHRLVSRVAKGELAPTHQDMCDAAFLPLTGDRCGTDDSARFLTDAQELRPSNTPREVLAEVFSDVFGAITAGPAFGLSQYERLLDTGFEDGHSDPHLSPVARLRLVDLVCEELGFPDSWGIRQRFDRLRPKGAFGPPNDGHEGRFRPQESQEIQFVDWVVPRLLRNRQHLQDAGLLSWQEPKVLDTCSSIAVALGEDDALAVRADWTPELIAAAAQLEDHLRRPFYPTGRVLLSICYWPSDGDGED